MKGGAKAKARVRCADKVVSTWGVSGCNNREKEEDQTWSSVDELTVKCCVTVDPVRESESDDADFRSLLRFLGS